MQQVANAKPPRKRNQTLLHFLRLPAREHKRQIDVVAQRKGVKQIEILKHKAQVIAPEGGDFALRDLGEAAAAEQHLSAGRLVERRQDV